MDLTPDTSLDAFRDEVRAAIAHDLPAELRERQIAYGGLMSDPHDMIAWTRILAKRGWVTPHWPERYGGLGWSPLQIHVFEQELCDAYAPATSMAGSHMIGPVIYTFGSDALRERFLPAIRRGDYIWAQGFSEPGNGSDLANLRTQAVLDGDRYIVNGQKICAAGIERHDDLLTTGTMAEPNLTRRLVAAESGKQAERQDAVLVDGRLFP